MKMMPAYSQAKNMQELNADLLNRFVSFIDAKPRTIESYARALKQFFRYLTARSITAPNRHDILAYRDHLKSVHKATTVQSYIIAVKQFFKWCEAEAIYANVAQNVKGAHVDKSHKKDPLTSQQAQQVLKGINTATEAGKRDFAILALMLTTGVRTIEVSRANIADIRTVGDSTVLFIQGKGRDEKNEYVKLAPEVEHAIRNYLKERGRMSQDAPLFASTSNNSTGERMTTRSISAIVKSRLITAGYDSDRITAHSLRHTAATLNLMNGASLEETQQLLRHANINTTMIYLHHMDRAKNNSEQRIAAAIF
jgi:integrase/recombinase XerC